MFQQWCLKFQRIWLRLQCVILAPLWITALHQSLCFMLPDRGYLLYHLTFEFLCLDNCKTAYHVVGIQYECKNETSAVFNAVLYTILPYSNRGTAYCFNSKYLAWKKISLLSRSNAQSSQPWTRHKPKVAPGKIFLIPANTRNKLIKISHCLDMQYANSMQTERALTAFQSLRGILATTQHTHG